MISRTTQKSVKSEADKKSWLGRFKQRFSGKTETIKTTVKKNFYHRSTDEEILEMFKLRRENPNLTQEKIGILVGVKEQVAFYWLSQKEDDVLANLKAKKGRRVIEEQREQRIEKRIKDAKRKIAKSKQNQKGKKTQTDQKEHTQHEQTTEQKHTHQHEQTKQEPKSDDFFDTMNLNQKLDFLDATEKYPEEHLLDGSIYGDQDSRLLADPDKFKIRKRSNNGLRKVYAVLRSGSEQERTTLLSDFDTKRVKDMKVRHQKKEPRDHHGTPDNPNRCPCGVNEPDWVITEKVQTVDIWTKKKRRMNWDLYQYKIKMEEKAKLDKQREKKESTVAELAKKGTKLCKVCDQRLSYSQSTRSSSMFDGAYYCQDHEPKSGSK